MGAATDEVRECIRRLVAVIRRSSTGGSPVDGEQLEHIQKVIRVLSLSEEQVSSMRIEERAQVLQDPSPQQPNYPRSASQTCLSLTLSQALKPTVIPTRTGAQDTEQRAAEDEVSQQFARICEQQ